MINRIYSIYLFNKGVFRNISYLTVVQVFTMVLPFITYPYLIKTLGLSLYGQVMLSQAVISYIAIFINFGFNISAVKSVAESLNNKFDLNRICSAIIVVKVIIWIVVTVFFSVGVYYFVSDHNLRVMYITAYTLTFNELLVCQWFYQAIDELKIIALVSTISKVVNVILVFIFIRTVDDYYIVSIISGACFFVSGCYCTYHLFRFHIKFVRPNLKSVIKVTKDSLNLFLTSAVIAIKNKTDVVLIGIFISPEYVAVYDFAQKILNIMLLPVTIINNAIFSKMNREKNSAFLKKAIFVSLLIATSYVLFSELIIEYVMHYAFITSHDSVLITRLMMLSVVFFSVSLPLAQNGLIVFGYTKLHLYGMLATTFLYLTLILYGYTMAYLDDIYYFVITSLLLFGFEMVYRYLLCKWKRIL